MTTKSTSVKNYIKDAGVNTQIFLFAGYDPDAAISNSTQVATNTWNYSDFSMRVGKQSLTAVIPYVKWVQSRPYKAWSTVEPNTGNFYAYNDQNGYVYLCISNNTSNRKDTGAETVSTIRPTHTAGIQRYSDGYSWKPMYRITPSLERFVTSKWLPIISFETFDNTETQTQLSLTQTFCNNSTSTMGNCGVYAKLPLSTDDNSGTIEYETGTLFTVAENISCSDCHYLMYNNEKFKSVFYQTTDTIPTSITIYDNYSLVGSLIASNQLSQASPYYYLYDINENDQLNEGAIVSVFIDLSGFSTSQLITTIQNPEFTITSNTGTDGRIRLLTSLSNGNYVISGIEVITSGSYYKDITLDMNSSYISMDIDMLLAAITVNLDTVDGLGFDPVDVLGSEHVMVDARIDKKLITDSGILLSDRLNYFSMIENPLSESPTTGKQWISGSEKTVNSDVIYRTSVSVKIDNATSDLPDTGEYYNVKALTSASIADPTITSATTNDILIGGTQTTSSVNANVELKNVLFNKSDYLVGLTLGASPGKNPSVRNGNTIAKINAKPTFVQYSGKPVITSKLNTALSISDTDSVIIRINMVKGM